MHSTIYNGKRCKMAQSNVVSFLILTAVLLCFSAKAEEGTVNNEQEIKINTEIEQLASKNSSTFNRLERNAAIMIFPGAFFFFAPTTISAETFSSLQPQLSFSPVLPDGFTFRDNVENGAAPLQTKETPIESQSIGEKIAESLFMTGYIPAPPPLLVSPSLRGSFLNPTAATATDPTTNAMQPNIPAVIHAEETTNEEASSLHPKAGSSIAAWNYRHQGADWIMPVCGDASSKKQSPIHIVSNRASIGSKEQALLLDFAEPSSFYTVTDNGHSLQLEVPLDEREGSLSKGFGSIFVNQKEYKVIQFHFHAPAEHTFGTETSRRALELHIVTKFNDSDLIVVGVTFKPSLTDSTSENSFLDAILSYPSFSLSSSYTVDAITYAKPLRLASLFNSKGDIFYTYAGSLTTPPCSEIVTWYVLEKPVVASEAQLSAFTDLFAYPGTNGNYRVLQNTAERQHNSQPLYVVRGHLT